MKKSEKAMKAQNAIETKLISEIGELDQFRKRGDLKEIEEELGLPEKYARHVVAGRRSNIAVLTALLKRLKRRQSEIAELVAA